MTIQPTSPSAAPFETPAPAPAEQGSRPALSHLDSFMRDVGSSLKEAEQGIHGAFDKLRHKNPDAASALPAPALSAETAAAALPAAAPVVLKGLEAIKAELEKLVTAHGGFGQLAADGVQMIEGAIADPKMEGAVVLADLAKVIAQMVSDLVLHAPSAPAPAEAAPDHA